MEYYSVYEDVANRTGGDIYVGVVGPVRTGKSTFIKRFMQTLVLPFASDGERAVMTDELPQSAAGKTVMTTEPKFVPAKAAKIAVAKGAEAKVRLVDCVGFAVDGANGFEEDGEPRLVKTPWQETPMPFERAAEVGTEKVIREHSTIGVLVTTDGSITGIERNAYLPAEERAVAELKAIGKPFVIVLNCKEPQTQLALKTAIEEKYGASVVAVNIEEMGEAEILEILQKALFEFPVACVDVYMPKWLQSFPESNETVGAGLRAIKKIAPTLVKMRDCFALENLFEDSDDFLNPQEIKMELGTGRVSVELGVKEDLFYRVLSGACGENIDDELSLMRFVCALSKKKESFDKIKDALEDAERNGYGIVYPTQTDYELEKPQLVKKNAGYGAQFKAHATSYHIVKVEIGGTVNPIIGTKEQGEEFVGQTLSSYEAEDGQVWETNIFGRSLRSLVEAELAGKNNSLPPELRKKIRRIIGRIVNEGKNNLFCFVF